MAQKLTEFTSYESIGGQSHVSMNIIIYYTSQQKLGLHIDVCET